jgi:hypothetical protein
VRACGPRMMAVKESPPSPALAILSLLVCSVLDDDELTSDRLIIR